MSILEQVKYISSGMMVTFKLVPCVIIATIILGFIIAMVQFYRVPVLSHIIDLYVLTMRGIPPLIVIMLLYYTINMSNGFEAAFVCLSIYHAAYVTEIVRGGFAAIPKGQITPALCGQFILVIKDTTLISLVGLDDIMWSARQIVTLTFNPLMAYLIVFVMYYLICFAVELIANAVERKLSTGLKAQRLSESRAGGN